MGFEALSGKTGPSIYMICSFFAFFFLTVGTPIGQFKGRGRQGGEDGFSKLSCVTLWGIKEDCRKVSYSFRVDDLLCDSSNNSIVRVFRAAEAFAIISIIVTLASCILNVLYLVGRSRRAYTVVLAVLGVAVTLIPWACMASVWHGSTCSSEFGRSWRSIFKYSIGFGLLVAAWCLQLVGTVSLIVLRH